MNSSTGMADGCVDCQTRPPEQKRSRLVGLDVLRGLTMAVMLLVDYAGNCYPAIDHAPWDGIHLADFVMPFFLWVSGASMSISLRLRPGQTRWRVFAAAAKRAVRLFLLGIIVQGGWYHLEDGASVLSLDLSTVRWMGILQRIALVFLFVTATELLVPSRALDTSGLGTSSPGAWLLGAPRAGNTCGLSLFCSRRWKLAVALACSVFGTVLTYAVKPPESWPGCASEVFMCGPGARDGCTSQGAEGQLRHMGCSAVGYLDSHVLGISHMYIRGAGAPSWPPTWGFDPEGIVTTCSAVLPAALGLHVGLVWVTLHNAKAALLHWLVLGLVLIAVALFLSMWVPFNKRLWSPSYSLIMCGLATLFHAGFFLIIDAATLLPGVLQRISTGAKVVLSPFQWLGENCILFFVLSDCCGTLDWLLRSVSWGQPHREKNVVYWFQNTVLMKWFGLGTSCGAVYEQCGPAVMTFVWIEIFVWMVACGVLHWKGICWKI